MDTHGLSYTLAHTAIRAVFDWCEEVCESVKYMCFPHPPDDLPTWHTVEYGNIHSTPQTMCIGFLQQYNLHDLRALLLLYRATTPDSWSPVSANSCRKYWLELAEKGSPIPCLKFGKKSSFKAALNHIDEQISRQEQVARERASRAWVSHG